MKTFQQVMATRLSCWLNENSVANSQRRKIAQDILVLAEHGTEPMIMIQHDIDPMSYVVFHELDVLLECVQFAEETMSRMEEALSETTSTDQNS